jgi:predicted choloylglycine hydrolase
MDYYVDYNMDEIRSHGMDVQNVEDGLIDVFFPSWIATIARNVKDQFIAEKLETTMVEFQRCSTVALRAPNGHVYFGRNLDWLHDACLILRVHKDGVPTTVSVIDLHYLNLNRDDLEATNLIERIPLLFAPYYVQDGMNQYGLAVADMSVDGVKMPHDGLKPNVLHSTAMRLILDYAKNTDEAIELLKEYNLYFIATTCHLMIADARGKSAVVEYIDGKIEITTAQEKNWQVCTNHKICGTSEEQSDQTCDRYRTASDELARMSGTHGADDVMRVMESVSKENWTMWSSVYDLTDHTFRVAYRRHYDKPFVGSLVDSN